MDLRKSFINSASVPANFVPTEGSLTHTGSLTVLSIAIKVSLILIEKFDWTIVSLYFRLIIHEFLILCLYLYLCLDCVYNFIYAYVSQ